MQLFQNRIVHAREKARHLHHRFGVESPAHVDVYGFAERLGVQVVESQLGTALAQLIKNRRRTRVLVSDRITDPALRRVAVAHELGHLLCGHSTPPIDEMVGGASREHAALSVCNARQSREHEHEANSFALELLTPARTVDGYRERVPDLALCSELATMAWVPIDYAAVRIAETSERMCAVVLSDRSGSQWVARSRAFSVAFGDQHRAKEGPKLDARTLAARILDRGSPCEPADVPAAAWLGERGLALRESSTPIGPRVLTILWAGALETALGCPPSTRIH